MRICDSTPSDTGARGHSDPMDIDAVNSLSLSSGKRKGSSSPRDGCFKYGGAHFQRDCNARKSTGKQSYGKANRASHGTRVRAGVKKTRKNPKEPKVRTKVPKAHTRAKHRKLVSQVLKTRNRRQARNLRKLHKHVPLTLPGTMVGMVTNGTTAGVLMNGMMPGVLLDGTKVGNKRVTLLQAHFYLEVWMSGPPVVRSGLNGRRTWAQELQ